MIDMELRTWWGGTVRVAMLLPRTQYHPIFHPFQQEAAQWVVLELGLEHSTQSGVFASPGFSLKITTISS